MKSASKKTPAIAIHRRNLLKLTRELKQKPFDFLPERSMECLRQFFNGYRFFGMPVWRDLGGFEHWLSTRLTCPIAGGARWWQSIELNSRDSFESYEKFFRLYGQYSRRAPIERQPDTPETNANPQKVNFYSLLYRLSLRPGMYMGGDKSAGTLAAYITGYFKGKADSRSKLTRDEREYLRFEKWLCRHHRLPKIYPWHRIAEVWWRGPNSFEDFFAQFDAYLTNYGKRPRGLCDRFEVIVAGKRMKIQRREMPAEKPVMGPEFKVWWRQK